MRQGQTVREGKEDEDEVEDEEGDKDEDEDEDGDNEESQTCISPSSHPDDGVVVRH